VRGAVRAENKWSGCHSKYNGETFLGTLSSGL
jgi:hypothetical protein